MFFEKSMFCHFSFFLYFRTDMLEIPYLLVIGVLIMCTTTRNKVNLISIDIIYKIEVANQNKNNLLNYK